MVSKMLYTDFAVLQLFGFLGLHPWDPNNCKQESLPNLYITTPKDNTAL